MSLGLQSGNKFDNWNLSIFYLKSQMSPHVMYGNAVWFLGLSRGTVSHIILTYIGVLQYTTPIFRFTSLHSLRQYIRRECDNYIQSILIFIIAIYFYHYNTIINTNTYLSVTVPKFNPPLLAYLIWCSSSPLCFFYLLVLLVLL